MLITFCKRFIFDILGLKVSERILVSSRDNKVSEFVGQISQQYVDSRRKTKEGATNEEFEIATTGPNITNCNSVVKETMDHYWTSRRGTWHIFRSSVIKKVKSSTGNIEVMDIIMNTENNLPFMN